MRETSLKQWPQLMRSAVMIPPTQLTDWATRSARTALDQSFDMLRSWRERMTQLATHRRVAAARVATASDQEGALHHRWRPLARPRTPQHGHRQGGEQSLPRSQRRTPR
ncbi:MAG: hypothetical protein IPF83_12710 [Rhodanobacteraceae bacterium]|nr:hypothetical protein [Rhodanobacteraceae bacterium]